jgi:hypothetical protein
MTRQHAEPASNKPLMLPSSIGELFDRISILELKERHIVDAKKLSNVRQELKLLRAAEVDLRLDFSGVESARRELAQVNAALWAIEDQIRECERRSDFGPRFIELARSVYHQNDRRAELKYHLNVSCGSILIEEKSY